MTIKKAKAKKLISAWIAEHIQFVRKEMKVSFKQFFQDCPDKISTFKNESELIRSFVLWESDRNQSEVEKLNKLCK